MIGGWWRLVVVGGWRLVAAGGWRRLVVVAGWRLVEVGGWWRLAVGGWWSLGAVLKGGPPQKTKKIWFLKDRPAERNGGGGGPKGVFLHSPE